MKRAPLLTLVAIAVLSLATTTQSRAQFKKYKSEGNGTIIVEKPEANQPALLKIKGNSGSRHFTVTSFDADNNIIDLLVTSNEPYSGIVAIDLPTSQQAAKVKIVATGAWSVDVYPISAAPTVSTASPRTDAGDSVLLIEGEPTDAMINGNPTSGFFAVTAFDKDGKYLGLLANSLKPYSGVTPLPRGARLLKIAAVDEWKISLLWLPKSY